MSKNKPALRGVNLGGWLVLEKWITPSVFDGTNAQDEYSLHIIQTPEKVISHYDNFITKSDFQFLSEHNINALRIPIGYGIFGDFPPYPKTVQYLDFAFVQADKYNFQVIIDLHTAPGSQNGYDHSGVLGEVNWDKNPSHISQTLNTIDKLAGRYCKNKNLFGISLLNEPHINIAIDFLENFYTQGYNTVRKHCTEDVAVIISDSFRPLEISKLLQGPNFKNVIIDTHFYQCFNEDNKKLTMNQIIKDTKSAWPKIINKVQKIRYNYLTSSKNNPIICGEWSLGINSMSLSEMSPEAIKLTIKEFGSTQMNIFDSTAGWFFWTYKTESIGGWNFKSSVEDGILTP